MKAIIISILMLLALMVLTGCSKTEKAVRARQGNITEGSHNLHRIYVPEYYRFRNGKHTFIKGHYRWVLNRRNYLRRSWKGYTTEPVETRAR